MNSHFNGKLLSNLLAQDLIICSWGSFDKFSIQLTTAILTMYEGELVINYVINNEIIYFITFSIVPGDMFGSSEKNIVFIGGSQGSKNCFELIQSATKSNFDVSPQASLITCLKAVTLSIGVLDIVGISEDNQVAVGRNHSKMRNYNNNYNDLWIASGGIQNLNGDFLIPTHLYERPINDIKKGHRIRTKRKRNFKRFLYMQTLLSFEKNFFDQQISLGIE